MSDDDLNCVQAAEALRKKSRYRELILSGKLVLPHERAAQLLGPDCLYHLYSLAPGTRRAKSRPETPSAPKRAKSRRSKP